MRPFILLGLLFFTIKLFGMKAEEDKIREVKIRPDQKLIALIVDNKLKIRDCNDNHVTSFKEPGYIYHKIRWCKQKDLEEAIAQTGQEDMEFRQYTFSDKHEFTLIATVLKETNIQETDAERL